MSDQNEFSLEEQILMKKIEWVHQRQLTTSVLLLSAGFGAIQILINVKVLCILLLLYFLLTIAFMGGVFVLFEIEGDILGYQDILQNLAEKRPQESRWDYPKSRLEIFYIKNGFRRDLNCFYFIGVELLVIIIFVILFFGIMLPDLIILFRHLILGRY